MGKHSNKKQHIPCRRCGRSAYNMTKGVCFLRLWQLTEAEIL